MENRQTPLINLSCLVILDWLLIFQRQVHHVQGKWEQVPSSQVIIKPLNSDDLTLIRIQIQCSPFQAVTGKIYRL